MGVGWGVESGTVFFFREEVFQVGRSEYSPLGMAPGALRHPGLYTSRLWVYLGISVWVLAQVLRRPGGHRSVGCVAEGVSDSLLIAPIPMPISAQMMDKPRKRKHSPQDSSQVRTGKCLPHKCQHHLASPRLRQEGGCVPQSP